MKELYGYKRLGMRPSLPPVKQLLAILGNPQKKIDFIHVAGTNGKGSTTAYIASILAESGYKTGAFFSPHLVDYRERIQINGRMVSKQVIVKTLNRMGRLYDSADKKGIPCPKNITFFEWTTALAFCCFVETGVDVAVMETGMGGRFDATNVIDPLVSVITNISKEHTAFLGNTIGSIAYEKAGIIKRGRPVVFGDKTPQAVKVIHDISKKRGTTPLFLGKNFSITDKGEFLSSKGERFKLSPCMPGAHQLINSAVAVQAVLVSGLTISEKAIAKAVSRTRLPGRFEIVKRKKRTLIFDAAHNPAAVKLLVSNLKAIYPNRKFDIIFGVLRGKNFRMMLKMLAPVTASMACITPDDFRAVPANALLPYARKAGIKAVHIEHHEMKSIAKNSSPRMLLVTGSFTTLEAVKKNI